MKKRGITTVDLAKQLKINTGQIYYWNKHGILATNPHFKALKEIIPEIQPREPTTKLNEQEDGRCRSGRKQKQLNLTETDLPNYKEPEFKSTLFPKIYWHNKTT